MYNNIWSFFIIEHKYLHSCIIHFRCVQQINRASRGDLSPEELKDRQVCYIVWKSFPIRNYNLNVLYIIIYCYLAGQGNVRSRDTEYPSRPCYATGLLFFFLGWIMVIMCCYHNKKCLYKNWVCMQVLVDFQENPKAAQEHTKNPGVMDKIQKLISAGIVQMR